MSTEIKATTLYYRGPGSDKVYRVAIEKDGKGYRVNGWNGARGGGLTPRPQTPDGPVDLATAETLFAKVIKEKTSHRKTPYTIGPDLKGGGAYTPPEHSTDTQFLPQLLTALDDPEQSIAMLRSENYAMQEKIDGERIIIVANAEGIVPFNRNGKVSNRVSQFIIEIAARLYSKSGPFIFDGETVGETYHIFDLLNCEDQDLRMMTFRQRQKRLDVIATQLAFARSVLKIVPTFWEHDAKVAWLQRYHDQGAEGVVLKRTDATYQHGRARDQFKCKFTATGSFVVVKKNQKASVRLGVFTLDGELVEVGNCSIRNTTMGKQIKEGGVVEVEYLYAHRDGDLTQARMLSVRDELKASDCSIDQLRYKQEARV